ncbi:MAG: hypothetical protein NVS9B10_20140 [Nevskia sp.]
MARPRTERRPPRAPAAAGLDAEAARAAILAAVAQIPAGRVATYGQVAWIAGLPGRARLVGRVLGSGVDAAERPWHRVINARGEISLPKFSPAHREQKRRLRAEGIAFVEGRISLRRYGWHAGDASPLID